MSKRFALLLGVAVTACVALVWFVFSHQPRQGIVPGTDAGQREATAVAGGSALGAADRSSGISGNPDTSSRPAEARPIDGNRVAVKGIQPSSQARNVLSSVSNFGALYRDLKARESKLTGDELLALREVLTSCLMIATIDQNLRAAPGALARVSANPLRASSVEKLRLACAEVPDSELGMERRTALSVELNRRDHPIVNAETLKVLTDLGFGTQSHDRAVELLTNAEPAVMLSVAEYLAHEIRFTGMSPALRERGLDVEHMTSGWRLASCDLAGGCGSDSLDVLEPCIVLARCDANSLSEYMQKYEPEKYASANQFRQLILASYQSGDWTWLNLPALRAKLPA